MSDLLNSNPCHKPAGPGGGEFCKTGGGGGNVSGASDPVATLTEYQDQGYKAINSHLRKGGSNPELDKKVSEIDSLFNNESVKSVNLVRADGAGLSSALFGSSGITKEMSAAGLSLGKHDDFFDKKPPSGNSWEDYLNGKLTGKIFEDNAFVSTSKSEKIVNEKFVDWGQISPLGGQGIVHISGKSKSIDVDSITRMGAKEQEILLPRGSRFKVKKVSILTGQREGYVGSRGEGFKIKWDVEIL